MKNKWSIYASNKSAEILLYDEETGQVWADGDQYFLAGKYMLQVFDIGWTKVGEL